MHVKKYILAIKYFREALKFKNDEVDVWYNLGKSYEAIEDREHYCKCLKQAIKLGDKESEELFKLGCN